MTRVSPLTAFYSSLRVLLQKAAREIRIERKQPHILRAAPASPGCSCEASGTKGFDEGTQDVGSGLGLWGWCLQEEGFRV